MTNFLTPASLAARWECSPGFVHRLIKSGALPAVSIGKMWRIRNDDADAFEAAGGTATPSKEPCDVYVVRCGNHAKIGKAEVVGKRLAVIQACNPLDIETVAILTEGDGHILERELHRRFQAYHHRGEWFRIEGHLAEWIAGGCQNTKFPLAK